MERCLELAACGLGTTYPNPMVGSVIVYDRKIIGEGWHHRAGEPHAEVNAINSVKNRELLERAMLYVNLEPCSHHGRTPPCADLILQSNIKRVVIAMKDPHEKVCGQGIAKLRDNGVQVDTGVLEEKARFLNRRFLTFHQKRRPYVILKWAESADSYLFPEASKADKGQPYWISNAYSLQRVHAWRGQEASILVGNKTVEQDNPRLNIRDFSGENPLRILIDRDLKVSSGKNFFDGSQRTIVFTEKKDLIENGVEYISLDFERSLLSQILKVLYDKQIQSLIVEGGAYTLTQFLKNNIWDEARVFKGGQLFYKGLKAPEMHREADRVEGILDNQLYTYYNKV